MEEELEHDPVNLGEGLENLIRRMGSSLTDARDITTTPTHDPRRKTYCLSFADGRRLKGRYFVSGRFAEVSRRIRESQALEFLPAVVAQESDAMLEEWIEGRALSDGGLDAESIQECGRIQAVLHRCSPPPVADLEFKPLEIADWARMMSQSLARLVSGGAILQSGAKRLEELAMANVPAGQALGIVHRDVCPENIVRDQRGRFFLVDNGLLTIGSIEEDLCRTWFCWPMMASDRDAFVAGYSQGCDAAAFENPSLFWRIVVMANSARFRFAASPCAAASVIRDLARLLQA